MDHLGADEHVELAARERGEQLRESFRGGGCIAIEPCDARPGIRIGGFSNRSRADAELPSIA